MSPGLLRESVPRDRIWKQQSHKRAGFPRGSAGKESTCNVGDLGLIPGLGRYPGKGKGHPLQYSDLYSLYSLI